MMDRVHLAPQLSPESLRIVGIGIYKDAKHIGVLCRESFDKKLRFIHLAFHDDLRLDDDTAKCFLWVEAKLEDEAASVAAAQARRIYRRYQAGGIPYGFSPYTGYFGPQGEIRWTAPGNGLTCATFVLAVFDSAGVRLAKGETWPIDRPEDKQFQREMIKLVDQRSDASAAHLKGMKADVGQIRPRVLEVAGAVAADVYPADFASAQTLGQQLQEILEGTALPPASP
jgi:hypothetical protein